MNLTLDLKTPFHYFINQGSFMMIKTQSLYIFYFTTINLTIFWPNFLVVLFNNVNKVRSEIWLLSFPHHSCQTRPFKSLVFDSWFERLFQHLWCGKHNTHISSSQYSLITAMGCQQCLPLIVLQLKGKHCRNGVVDTFQQLALPCLPIIWLK